MKRGFIIALALLTLLAGACLAEDASGYWTRREDLYYHLNESCVGALDAVPISGTATQAFGKYPCPVCVPVEGDGTGVRAAARGGTIVLRFSDAWMAEPELTGVFGWSVDSVYEGAAGETKLAEYLHGEAYNAFLAEYARSGSATVEAREPDVVAIHGERILSRRHIGGYWYVVVRPAEKFGDSWGMYWRIDGLQLCMENGALRTNFEQQTVEETLEVALERESGASPVYSAAAEGFSIEIYRALDMNVAVIYEARGDADALENACLLLGSCAQIELCGYMDGDSAVYCCVLDNAELEALRSGVDARLLHVGRVGSGLCYALTEGELRCWSTRDGKTILAVAAEGDADPVDADCRVVWYDESERFVVQRDGADLLVDMDGWIISYGGTDAGVDRLTPLIWMDGEGVFLTERCAGAAFPVGERYAAGGVDTGQRCDGGAYGEGWRCGLIDQDGNVLAECNYTAFSVDAGGVLRLETPGGAALTLRPIRIDG